MGRELKCNHCGALVERSTKRCSKCGRMILRREIKKVYTGVRMQQGRVTTDNDWSESVRITRARKEKARTRCESCGTLNLRNIRKCGNCGANL
ncbi:MAG: hypothetical protein ACXAEF_07715 [Candidatus Thorarchaeota archaeon]|jgi:rubrerythrin